MTKIQFKITTPFAGFRSLPSTSKTSSIAEVCELRVAAKDSHGRNRKPKSSEVFAHISLGSTFHCCHIQLSKGNEMRSPGRKYRSPFDISRALSSQYISVESCIAGESMASICEVISFLPLFSSSPTQTKLSPSHERAFKVDLPVLIIFGHTFQLSGVQCERRTFVLRACARSLLFSLQQQQINASWPSETTPFVSERKRELTSQQRPCLGDATDILPDSQATTRHFGANVHQISNRRNELILGTKVSRIGRPYKKK